MINRVKTFFQNKLIRFITLFVLIYVVGYEGITLYSVNVAKNMWGAFWWEYVDRATLDLLTQHSAAVMRWAGVDLVVNERYMYLANNAGNIRIDSACLAIGLMVMFFALIISYPAKPKLKVIFITVGLLVIHALNVIRVSAVGIILAKYPQYKWPFVDKHHLFFDTSVYVFIFLMFVLFTRLSGKKLLESEQEEA